MAWGEGERIMFGNASGRSGLFGAIAALALLFGVADARELVPFPSLRTRELENLRVPPAAPPAPAARELNSRNAEFELAVRRMTNCIELDRLSAGLSQRRTAAGADQEYYTSLLRVVADRQREIRCNPPGRRSPRQ